MKRKILEPRHGKVSICKILSIPIAPLLSAIIQSNYEPISPDPSILC